MLKTIKRYELNDNVTEKDLLAAGFGSIEPNKYYLFKHLYNDIEMFIDVYVNEDGSLYFDDYETIDVIDDSYGQYYTPFYECKKPFQFLEIVIIKYNEAMDMLAEKGIFKPKVVEEVLEEPIKRTLKKD